MEDLAGELETVSARFPPSGELALWLIFGSLVWTDAGGVPGLAWLAYESSEAPSD